MNTRLFAALTAALCLCVESARGTDSQLPPASLPVGSPVAFRSWIVTNQIVNINDQIYYTHTNGTSDVPWGDMGRWNSFNSYPAYQRYIGSNSWRFLNEARPYIDPTKQVRFVTTVEYYIPELNNDYVIKALDVNTDIGTVSTITSNSFLSAPTWLELGYIRVPGLQRFVVEVNGLYTNSWPVQPGRPTQSPPPGFNPPQFPPELTTNNYVVLNRWYSMGTNQTTYTVATTALTRRYNRFGERLDQAPTLKTSNGCVTVSFVRGATVTIECSSNLVHWTTVTNFTDNAITGTYSMTMNKNQPRMFFRAGSR